MADRSVKAAVQRPLGKAAAADKTPKSAEPQVRIDGAILDSFG
jgi:hypothetical protein